MSLHWKLQLERHRVVVRAGSQNMINICRQTYRIVIRNEDSDYHFSRHILYYVTMDKCELASRENEVMMHMAFMNCIEGLECESTLKFMV